MTYWVGANDIDLPQKASPGNTLVSGRRKRELSLARRRHTPEQVIGKLRETGVAIAGRGTAAEAARRIGATGQTFCRWRSESGGPGID